MQNITIDITKRGVAPLVNVTDYDSMSRFFTLTLMNGGTPYTPPEGANYSVWYKTTDSKGWYDTITLPDQSSRPAVVADGNALTVEIAATATTSCGELAVMITGADGYQLTVTGIMTRSADIPGYDGQEVENYYNVYITRMQENAARAENAADIAVAYGATVEVDEAAQQLNITHHSDTEGGVGWLFGSAIMTDAEGSVAAFSDGADDVAVKSLVAEITPVQSGSGDPSPTNIRPISGRTGMTVTRSGKNLLNPALTYGLLSLTIGALETDITQSTRYGYTERFPSTSDIVLSMRSTDTTKCEYARIVQYVDGVVVALSQQINFANTSTWYTRTLTGIPNSYCRLVIGAAVSDCGDHIYGEGQIEIGSTASEYEPYTGTTIPITWESIAGTVYGGTLDVVSGVLTVDREIKTITGSSFSSAWNIANSADYQTVYRNASGYLTGCITSGYDNQMVTNLYATQANGGSHTVNYAYLQNGYLNIRVPLGTFADSAAFNTFLNENPMQVYYTLATPTTYQLSPTEIKTLLGGNTIYTDAGSVSVDYIADTKLYIDNKVAELQALILEN